MNPEAEAEDLNGQADLPILMRHDSKSSTSGVSTDGTPSASLALEPETCSNGTSSTPVPPQQHQSSLHREDSVSRVQQKFPTHEPTPGQPLYALLMESSENLQAGDHILYQSSKPPFRIMYRSALVTEIQGTDSNLKVNFITNVSEIGVTQKQVYLDELENLHKLEYDTCRYSSEESIERATRRLKLKEKCYHALYNNSHFFVTWCKTGREYPLTDILEEINQDPKVANKVNLPPIVYKTTVISVKMLKPGDHVMLDSQHYLVEEIAKEGNAFSAYFINEGQVEWKEAITWEASGNLVPFIIHCSKHPDATDPESSLKQAEKENKRKTKWEKSDVFVTAMKCGRQHSVDNEYIIDHNVSLIGYTHITPKEKIVESDHLVFTDLKSTFHSVLVMKCFNHTQVTIKPALEEGEVIDLTTYPEVYRVEYSSCLPPEQTLVRGNSKKLSQSDYSCFATWAKTGKELSPLSLSDPKFSVESLKESIDKIQVGDHIVECTIESNRRHFMVTKKSAPSQFTLIFCQTGGLVREETLDLSHKELYRIKYPPGCPPICEAIARAQSQLDQQKYSPWDQMMFIIQAKLGIDGHENIYVSHCKQLLLKEKISDGNHLIIKDNQRKLYSVLVEERSDHIKVKVRPPVNGKEVFDLTSDFEVYRIEYSDSLPARKSKSKKDLSVSLSDFMEAKFAVERINTVSQIQFGDHLIEHVNSTCRKHYIVIGIKKKSLLAVIS